MNSDLGRLTDPITTMMVEVGHQDVACLSNAFAMGAQTEFLLSMDRFIPMRNVWELSQEYPVIHPIYQSDKSVTTLNME